MYYQLATPATLLADGGAPGPRALLLPARRRRPVASRREHPAIDRRRCAIWCRPQRRVSDPGCGPQGHQGQERRPAHGAADGTRLAGASTVGVAT